MDNTLEELIPLIYEIAAEQTHEAVKSTLQAIIVSENGVENATEYFNSFSVDHVREHQNIVRFKAVSPIIEKKEIGIKPYSIKEKMLQVGQKGVKMSKKGTLYRDIPLMKEFDQKKPPVNPTEREMEVREQIQEALAAAKLSLRLIATTKATGNVSTIQQKKGLVVASMYENKKSYREGKAPQWQAVLFFRRMSNAPGTSEWRHPGKPGINVEKQIKDWQVQNEKQLYDDIIMDLIEAIGIK